VAASSSGIDVMTGNGVLRILALQRPGGRRVPVADALRGHPVQVGQVFNLVPTPAPRTPGTPAGR
jgi:methionyl-tRNA formyltransferase